MLTAVRDRADALAGSDRARLGQLLHPAFRWTSHRGVTVDRDTYIANNTDGRLVWSGQELSDVRPVVVGDVGVVTAIATDHVVRDGVSQTFRMPMTQTWLRSDGEWQCLAGHAGPLV